MTSESSPSPLAAELENVKSQVKALKAVVARLESRLEDIEQELTALRNLI